MLSPVLQIPGIPGGPEVLLLLLLAVLLFGANKIPKLARSSGEAIGEFQKGRTQVEQELQEMKEGDDEEEASADVETESTTDSPSSTNDSPSSTTESEVESETDSTVE